MRAEHVQVPWRFEAFPFLFGGTFIEGRDVVDATRGVREKFPFLFGGTFIEGYARCSAPTHHPEFPFLFGGTFIEGGLRRGESPPILRFPFLFGETFIEGGLIGCSLRWKIDFPSFSEGLSLRGPRMMVRRRRRVPDFPSFSEGLSLRAFRSSTGTTVTFISLPFRRDFH